MNTNDPKAPYGHQPLLSDEDACDKGENKFEAAIRVRDHYESLIQKGVLRVAGKVTFSVSGIHLTCSGCKVRIQESLWEELPVQDHCPGCGNEIQKP